MENNDITFTQYMMNADFKRVTIVTYRNFINTFAFANGVYFFKLSNDKDIAVRKFVKE